VGRLVDTEVAPVAGGSVEAIVDPLGYDEELGIAAHDQPAHVKVCIERIANEHMEHFSHSAALGRRTDVPDHSTLEPFAARSRDAEEVSITLSPDKRFQVDQGAAVYEDLVDGIVRGRRIARPLS
jgi:hypothetical protein